MASVLVLAFAHGALAVGVSAASAETSVYDYAGHLTYTVQGCGDEELMDFPLRVHVSENDNYPPGFSYQSLANGTNDLVFVDSTGRSLSYEIETWDTAGTSTFWVKVPHLRNGATVVMCWGLRDGASQPAQNDPADVWSDYVGVWHMDEVITADTAQTTYSADATGHGLDAVPRIGSEGVYTTMTSTPGVFGNARVNDTSARNKRQGSYLFVGNKDGRLDFGDTFTVSFWVKFDDYANWPQMISCRTNGTSQASNWQTSGGFKVELVGDDKVADYRQKIIARGDKSKNNKDLPYVQVVDKPFKEIAGFTHLALVYRGDNIEIYADGVAKSTNCPCVAATAALSGMAFGNNVDGTEQSFWGKYDEIRLVKGAKSDAWIAAEVAQTNLGFCAAGGFTNDMKAVLKNSWATEPTISQTVWKGRGPTRDDFTIDPAHGAEEGIQVVVYNRSTGEIAASNELEQIAFPQNAGSYRVVVTVPPSVSEGSLLWGGLETTLGYRIAENEGSHEFNVNVARILLGNDDYTVEGGEVEWQGYDDEDPDAGASWWRHLDADGNDASTTYAYYWSDSFDFNLGGGTHHIYRHGDAIDRLWDLRDVRIGNTFHNGEDLWERRRIEEQYAEGLEKDQNYLPWNPDSQRVLNGRWSPGDPVGGSHRYVGHVVMQNTTNAAVTSTCYTNGIGTIYFDAVNGWTGNVTNGNGEASYRLIVEIATNKVGTALPPTERYVSFNASPDITVEDADEAREPFYGADWVRWNGLRVLRFEGDYCEDLGTTNAVDLKITKGGTYESFYRVIVPVNLMPKTGGIRFRIRRETIVEDQRLFPDGTAYILLDNVICSEPAACVQLAPYGKYFPEKHRPADNVEGWEGAFDPAYPSVTDAQVYGRAKATLPDGSAIPKGVISAATMHYRWHYLEQQTTGWLEADLVPETLVTQKPLELPPYQGDIDFWFDAVQHGHYYVYADYSGTDLRLGGTGYSEEIPAVTNRADGADWFVRTREGKSEYGELKLLVRETENGRVDEYPLSVMQDSLWRGYYRMTNVHDCIWWRIEARNRQENGATDWNWSTNRWYVTDWTDTTPTFPAAGRMSEGTTNSWSRIPCDMQTGYLTFQVDETSLGVTVIHSDYQAFDRWSDAAKGYFTGSSTEEGGRSGSSSDVREYAVNYASWADTPATNKGWRLSFDKHTIGESPLFTGYKTFSSFNDGTNAYFRGWYIGKGMWVYGKYREPDSHIALQMAGNGEGYVELSDRVQLKDVWPRGLESVSFHSRIAQAVSPELMTYNMVGVWQTNGLYSYVTPTMLLTNYTFMTRACFDMQKNEGFSGNASVSLFAYYVPGTGAYEVRWEQTAGYLPPKGGDYDGKTLGPKPRGQRLVISRWDSAGSTYTNVVLCSVDNTSFYGGGFDMPTMPYADGMTATNNLMPFLVSVFKQGNDTVVVAGVRCTEQTQTSTKHGGVDWNKRVTEMSGSWYFACARDNSSKQLAGGAYGVLAANCEGMFLTPQWRNGISYPGHLKPPEIATGSYANKSLNSVQGYVDSYGEMKQGWWGGNRGRTAAFYDRYNTFRPFGFTYVKPSQTINVLAKPVNSTEAWDVSKHCIGQVPVGDFGHPFTEPDHKPTFYSTTDSVLRLQTGGTLDDFRIDVAISDVEVRQWRGWDSDTEEQTGRERYDAREKSTNFVFTSGWITNGAAQLCAKRTPTDQPCSIRSPLFDGYKPYGMGVGLGGIRFTYREPQTNIHLLVQIATNVERNATLLDRLTKGNLSLKEGDGNQSWLTVTNLYYHNLWPHAPEKGNTRTWSQSFGYHGTKGLMRVVVAPALVQQVSDAAWKDTSAFGAIDITSVRCFDEPALDKGCWWGWNLQVVGDFEDSQKRMYLPDGTWDDAHGYSLALNNSTTADVNPAVEAADFRKHVPFLQSPTFTNSAVIGQISFKARKYELSEYAPAAKVVLYGARKNQSEDDLSKDSAWHFVAEFPVTNTIYTTYTCKTDALGFRALRLAVVLPEGETSNPPKEAKYATNPQRVMLDEVTVSEAVRAMLAFRHVGAFRTDLNNNLYVTGVTTRAQQPLCDENWGVQAEVFATMLGDEIDKTYTPRVKLHWYVGTEPWGYANWKEQEAGSAWLSQTEGSNYVYRSSFKGSPDAVMPAQTVPGTVVQYMLEVEYQTIGSPTPGGKPVTALATNWLDSASWAVPEWYAPVDYNADPEYGAGKSWAAFNILDTVAPGWAWINEMNILGASDVWGGNDEIDFQYVEICVPMEADISGWRIRMLDLDSGRNEVTTNWVATFGSGFLDQAPGKKKNNLGAKYRKVFRCIGNKESALLNKENGTLDGVWQFSAATDLFVTLDGVGYIYREIQPFGVQLVRPSGIIESSIVVVGTNYWGRTPGYGEFDPTNVAAKLNRLVPGSKFYYAAEDCCGTFRSGSVTQGRAESAGDWANDWACSPGYINTNWGGKVEQKIDPDHPTPRGDSIVIYASVDPSGGPIRQWVGGKGSAHTNAAEVILLAKGSERGTNIVYQVDPWYEIAPVTTNGAVFWYEPRRREKEITVGKGASNNLTVVARAQADSDLRDKYGLDEKNPFTPAVLDWLHGGSTKYGPFAHEDGIGLADYWDMSNTCVTNLTLTQMYCLDMDPTVSNLILRAGMMNAWPVIDQTQHTTNVVPGYLGNDAQTNVRMQVFMMISNKVEAVAGPDGPRRAWAPYILRGLDPNYTSWDYRSGRETSRGWTSETFKVTGILANGRTREDNNADWKPLRWFVFHEGSFAADYTTSIEIEDPHAPSSQGQAYWYDWFNDKDHPERAFTPVFNRWAIDMRSKPVSVEILQPTNFFSSAASPQ